MKLKKYTTQTNDELSNKLKSYSALTGAFLLSAGAANSQIIYTDVNPDVIVQGSQYDVDMDADGAPDFGFLQFSNGGNMGAKVIADSLHQSNQVMGTIGGSGFYYPSRLTSGNPIGPAGAFKNFTNAPGGEMSLVFAYATGNVFGNFNGLAGYVGVQFTTGANSYYGWIDCEVATGATSITVKGFAYESTPLTPINAGDTAGVTGINNMNSALNNVGNFYPNAVRNGKTFIQIESNGLADLKLDIMNGMGQLVQNENRKLTSGKNLVALNVNSLATGTYFVKLTQGDQSYFRKLVVSN